MSKERETNLIELLKLQSKKADCSAVPKPQLIDYKSQQFYSELLSIYHKLNGTQKDIPFNIGNYDCVIDNTIVELDEENHFNRYRYITLEATIYKKNGVLNKERYSSYCKLYEDKCRKNGGFWCNDSSDRLFGQSDLPGIIGKHGSSRWKQRAFYDMLKDHIPLILNVPVKRISIYDEIIFDNKKLTIDNILKSGDKKFASVVYNKIFNT